MKTWRTSVMNTIVVFGALLIGAHLSDARKRSPTEAPPVVEVTVGGLVGNSVHLPCNLPIASPPNVQWYDEVFNEGEEPELIYNSDDAEAEDAGNMAVNDKHANAKNFHIGTDYSLTVSHLKIDVGPGKYFCRSTADDGTVRELVYQLTVIEVPACSGETALHSSHHMNLDCLLAYSGLSRPAVDWYRTAAGGQRHHRRDTRSKSMPELINSNDEYDLTETSPIARKIVRNRAHPIDDGSTYRCVVSIGDLTKECHLKLSVQYLAQKLHIHPMGNQIYAGDKVTCSAEGNPVPEISIEPQSDDSGKGWKSFVVGDEYIGQDLAVSCTAVNTVNGTTEQLSGSHTFHVAARPVPTEPTHKPTVHHGHHGHNNHQSHPPMNEERAVAESQPEVQKSTRGTASQTASALATMILSALVAYLVLN